ncbi:MAG: tetrathionate reductase family octaheme c-type cytochrome [Planctomycetota bacterium]|jgi:octaheme c-type cytochrome (tetrathionate reductase family)
MSGSRLFLSIAPFLLIGALVVWAALPPAPAAGDDPWAHVPHAAPHVDHSELVAGPFSDGPAVTRACLRCHEQEGHDFLKTSHWTWHGPKVVPPGQSEPMRIGKRNLINNFCIGIQSNWPRCTSCHAGYGWKDDAFDFSDPEGIDCLVCHDQTGTYRKEPTGAGAPAKEVDLVAAARSVGAPTRENCGVCHFKGGGGDAVKHGDMDATMVHPSERIDIHMGRHDFECIACHRAERHDVLGRSMAVSIDDTRRVRCTDCHDARPHGDARLDAHTEAVACTTCHIPQMAVGAATKMSWDWSTAGRDGVKPKDPRTYSKKKGTFTFAREVAPEYGWYNGLASRYITGTKIDPAGVVKINAPLGDASDATAKIWPFKIHRGKQVYDKEHLYLHVPKTFGKGGYWKDFDWDKALRLGAEATGLAYSGRYGFIETEMYWPLAHMVAGKNRALQCGDCHASDGRMDWFALGYKGDPIRHGGRKRGGLR